MEPLWVTYQKMAEMEKVFCKQGELFGRKDASYLWVTHPQWTISEKGHVAPLSEMSTNRAREQQKALAACIWGGALRVPVVLLRMQQFELLDKLRTITRKRRQVLFVGQVVIVLNSISIRVCDCLAAFLTLERDEGVPMPLSSC